MDAGIVNDAGTSTVWEIPFFTDEDALEAIQQTVANEGMVAFLDRANVIPFPKRPRHPLHDRQVVVLLVQD